MMLMNLLSIWNRLILKWMPQLLPEMMMKKMTFLMYRTEMLMSFQMLLHPISQDKTMVYHNNYNNHNLDKTMAEDKLVLTPMWM